MSALAIFELVKPVVTWIAEVIPAMKEKGAANVAAMVAVSTLVGVVVPQIYPSQHAPRETMLVNADLASSKLTHPFAQFLWARRVNEFEILFARIPSGTYIVRADEVGAVAIEMLRGGRIKKQLIATSSSRGWWDTDWGRRYEELNVGLAKTINIKRIFIYQDDEELSQLQPHMELQRRNGIEVWYVKRDPTHPEMANDYVILDDTCAGTLMLTPERTMVRAEFDVGQTQIDAVRVKLDTIMIAATKL